MREFFNGAALLLIFAALVGVIYAVFPLAVLAVFGSVLVAAVVLAVVLFD